MKEAMGDDFESVPEKPVLDVSLCPVDIAVTLAVTRADGLHSAKKNCFRGHDRKRMWESIPGGD